MKINLGLIEKIQKETKIDLAPDDGNITPVLDLLFKTRLLGDVLAYFHDEPREEFFRSLDGDALKAGWDELVESVVALITHGNTQMESAVRQDIENWWKTVDASVAAALKTATSDQTMAAIQNRAERLGAEMQAEFIKILEGKDAKFGSTTRR